VVEAGEALVLLPGEAGAGAQLEGQGGVVAHLLLDVAGAGQLGLEAEVARGSLEGRGGEGRQAGLP